MFSPTPPIHGHLPALDTHIKGVAIATERLDREIFPRLRRRAFHLTGNHEDAKDLVQDASLAILCLKFAVNDESHLIAIMRQKARRLRNDALRRRTFESEYSRGADSDEHAIRDYRSIDPEQKASETEFASGLRRALEGAMKGLSDRERDAFCLRYLENLSLGEVADELGLTMNSVKCAITRAKGKLQKNPMLAQLAETAAVA